MNIFRWRRKSKKKIKFKKIILFIFSLIMTTFAWFAYSKVLNTSLDIHVASWDMEYYIGTQKLTNPIGISIDTIFPTMDDKSVTIKIKNNGQKMADIEYSVDSVTIAGISFELVQEGSNNTSSNYIVLTPVSYEIDASGNEIAKGAIANDLTKFPFTILVEHTTQVASGGEGYLTVTVNWIGDQNDLDSEWGYKVGEYLLNNEGATAMTIHLTIESYQTPEEITERVQTLPTTSETNPYLPTGFTRVPGTTLEKGLVIKDSSGNEYVWIEVPKGTTVYGDYGLGKTEFSSTDYTTIENKLKAYASPYNTTNDVWTSYYETGLMEDEYNTHKQRMLESIYTNGGFYIGRYETGIANSYRYQNSSSTLSETPVIKPNAYPFNFVSGKQAQIIASGMASGDYTSSLMFGIQWDLVLKYMQVKGTETDELKTDSTIWGNYTNNEYDVINKKAKYFINTGPWADATYSKEKDIKTLLTTGANNNFFKQNIYDFGGNLSEWTFEFGEKDGKNVGGNGGDYTIEGTNSANYRASYDGSTGYRYVGFRVSIY